MINNYRKTVSVVAYMVIALFMLAACDTERSDDTDDTKAHTITFNSMGGNQIEHISVLNNDKLILPIPEKSGYRFIGWFYDDSEVYFNSTDRLNENISLHAKYEESEPVAYADYRDDNNPIVTIEVKDVGIMQIELFSEVAPNTVSNFIALVEEGYYDGVTFHRIIESFMIQGGRGANTDWSIVGEFSDNGYANPLSHTRGVISMARIAVSNDSASTQFFIVHEDNPFLDNQYAAFGGLVGGFDVLDAIASTPTNSGDAPLDIVEIIRVVVDTKDIDYDTPNRISR